MFWGAIFLHMGWLDTSKLLSTETSKHEGYTEQLKGHLSVYVVMCQACIICYPEINGVL